MKVLVTGAAGFVGSRLVGRLQSQHEVFAITGRRSPEDASSRAHWVEQDLTLPLDYSRLPDHVDVIIHLAQSRHYKQFPEQANDIFNVNVNSTFRLLNYAREVGAKKFIFTSTGGVYGTSYEQFVETDPVSPLNFYLNSKYIAELLLGNYQQFFRTIVFRLFFVYGVGQAQTMLIPRLVRSVLSGVPVNLQGHEGIRINPVYIDDVVDALERSLSLEGNHLINIGGPQVLSLREISRIIGDQLGREPLFNISVNEDPGHLVGDVTKMRMLLGAPRVAFPEGITEVCQEMKKVDYK